MLVCVLVWVAVWSVLAAAAEEAESVLVAACVEALSVDSDCVDTAAVDWSSPERVQLGMITAKISNSTRMAAAMGMAMGGMKLGRVKDNGPISIGCEDLGFV